jgi:hypothetical protein
MVGLSRFELLTPRLSSVCSNQLSYRPQFFLRTRPFMAAGSSSLPATAVSPHEIRQELRRSPAIPLELVKEPEINRFPQN